VIKSITSSKPNFNRRVAWRRLHDRNGYKAQQPGSGVKTAAGAGVGAAAAAASFAPDTGHVGPCVAATGQAADSLAAAGASDAGLLASANPTPEASATARS